MSTETKVGMYQQAKELVEAYEEFTFCKQLHQYYTKRVGLRGAAKVIKIAADIRLVLEYAGIDPEPKDPLNHLFFWEITPEGGNYWVERNYYRS